MDSKKQYGHLFSLRTKLLVGVVYRSPSRSKTNTDNFFHVIRDAGSKHGVPHVMLMGDFNMPEITCKWNYMYAQANDESLVGKLIDLTQDTFLHQHSQENTRFRIDQEPSQLDLLLMSC